MFLYKIEIALELQTVYLIVAAESDEKAFDHMESHLVRHFIHNPIVKEAVLVEKRRLDKGAGFIIETNA
jgi:predicted HD phosphohydrolase